MSGIDNIDLDAILASIKPSVVTPRISEFSDLNNDKKLRHISRLIVESMVDRYNKSNNVVTRIIAHDEKMTEIRYLNIEPLLSGVWPSVSLAILQLSYGEQTMLIEAIYPKGMQFAAKSFAATFTDNGNEVPQESQKPYTIQLDSSIEEKLDSSNAGIAMILAILGNQGYKTPHPDNVNTQLTNMGRLVADAEKELNYQNATQRAKDAAKYNDR